MTTDSGQAPPSAAPSSAQASPSPYYAAQGYATGQVIAPRGLSIAAMVCGIVGLALSFFLMGFLPALAGVILGHIGMKKEPTAKGFAITGLITGYAGLALAVIVFLITMAAIFIPLWFLGAAGSAGYLS
jgi:Domain of unknown function (DUF4190)